MTDKWKPISTAPKDQTIIGKNGNYVFKLYWDNIYDGGWLIFDDDNEFNATHWILYPKDESTS